jgi:tRNA 2-thiouridine synthesizing protein D
MSAQFSLLVTGSPTQSQAHLSALRFINAAIAMGHTVKQVFFYEDAVYVANQMVSKPKDELQLTQQWQDLAQQHQFELQVCVAAGNRRGILSPDEAQNLGFKHNNLASGFTVLGLAQLAASLSSIWQNQSEQKPLRFVHFK